MLKAGLRPKLYRISISFSSLEEDITGIWYWRCCSEEEALAEAREIARQYQEVCPSVTGVSQIKVELNSGAKKPP